jgi:DNA-binding HxlR family transcriptional regulator
MALRSDWSNRPCPIARGIDALGDPWVLLVLRELLSGLRRFDEIRDRMEVADNILTNRLNYMLDAGLVTRKPYREGKRPRYEYIPTQAATDATHLARLCSVGRKTHSEYKHPTTACHHLPRVRKKDFQGGKLQHVRRGPDHENRVMDPPNVTGPRPPGTLRA